jgi:hypothetical protein
MEGTTHGGNHTIPARAGKAVLWLGLVGLSEDTLSIRDNRAYNLLPRCLFAYQQQTGQAAYVEISPKQFWGLTVVYGLMIPLFGRTEMARYQVLSTAASTIIQLGCALWWNSHQHRKAGALFRSPFHVPKVVNRSDLCNRKIL